jgi:F-type H+-transporting ATPase subunit a
MGNLSDLVSTAEEVVSSTLGNSTILAEGTESLDGPSIVEVLPPAILFQGTPFEFTRVDLVRIVAAIILLTVFCIAAKRAQVIPGRFQSAIEFVLDFVRVQIVEPVMGAARGRKYLAFATSLFCAIAIFNLAGIIPGLNIAGTAVIGLPLVMAIWSVINYWSAGIKQFGLLKFLRHELFPPGIPWPVYIILAPVELLQLLVTRPVSLTVRLLANMISGHMLLVVCYAGTELLVFSADWAFKPFGILTFAGAIVFTCIEAGVAIIQAFIFTLLSVSYIEQSYPEQSSDEDAVALAPIGQN